MRNRGSTKRWRPLAASSLAVGLVAAGVAGAAQSERVENGGFESGDAPWTYENSQRCTDGECALAPASGTRYAILGPKFGYTALAGTGVNDIGTLSQTVILPETPAVFSAEVRRTEFDNAAHTMITIAIDGTEIYSSNDLPADSFSSVSAPIPDGLTGEGTALLEIGSECTNFDVVPHHCDRYDIDDVSILTGADTEPPQTTITKAPAILRVTSKRKRARAVVRFKSSEANSSFECKLDRKPYRACTSPKSLRLAIGRHTFRVRATDAAANTDSSPAKASIAVKLRR